MFLVKFVVVVVAKTFHKTVFCVLDRLRRRKIFGTVVPGASVLDCSNGSPSLAIVGKKIGDALFRRLMLFAVVPDTTNVACHLWRDWITVPTKSGKECRCLRSSE
jgi:hypothetical protein